MNRLAALIDSLSLADALLIQKDLEAGNITRLLRQKIASYEEKKVCPTCGRDMSKSNAKYAIEFGPIGLRQKAHFDELDCLNYFVHLLHVKESNLLNAGGRTREQESALAATDANRKESTQHTAQQKSKGARDNDAGGQWDAY